MKTSLLLLCLTIVVNADGRVVKAKKEAGIGDHLVKRTLDLNSRPRCEVSGDPHIITIDGRKFSYQGNCTYRAMSTRCPGGSGPVVLVKFDHRRSGNFAERTFVAEVDVNTRGGRVVMRDDGSMTVNGKLWSTNSFTSKNGYGVYDQDNEEFLLVRNNLIAVTYNIRRHHLVIYMLMDISVGEVCGLCGNFNNDLSDDLNGMTADDFGKSHQVSCP
ncbi:BMP-binding endothelial regulator protein-like [Ptychodera flava]|uniref:BMP-binding endothelial regulator protein-like n=1 Tax=Ptychodera flava TaxID=63121 RepID=UPI00396A8AD1